MAKQRTYDALQRAAAKKNAYKIRQAYLKAINTMTKLSKNVVLPGSNEFHYRNYSKLNTQVNKVLKSLYTDIYGTTISGINTGWDLAVEKNNKIALSIFGKNLDDLPDNIKSGYLSNNDAARRSFMFRKENGLGLSDKIWNNTKQFKQEMELALEYGIGKGKSAQTIAKQVQSYLNHPDKLFRRVKDDKGVLRLSKAAKSYHPGRGRYRSSYKNALRLASNENNFSYENSNYLKRQQQDFIVGVKIKVSPQHVPSDDSGGISCISLQGNYPKDFDWTYKWHVKCKCTSFHILKSEKELDEDLERILAGEKPLKESKNSVTSMPNSFTKYIFDNSDKWKNWKNKPRFITNNTKVIEKDN